MFHIRGCLSSGGNGLKIRIWMFLLVSVMVWRSTLLVPIVFCSFAVALCQKRFTNHSTLITFTKPDKLDLILYWCSWALSRLAIYRSNTRCHIRDHFAVTVTALRESESRPRPSQGAKETAHVCARTHSVLGYNLADPPSTYNRQGHENLLGTFLCARTLSFSNKVEKWWMTVFSISKFYLAF